MATKKLTPKQKQFCLEYLIDLNATQAAIRAGYSEKTACAIGLENLGKPLLAGRIQKLMEKRSAKTEITAENVLTSILDTRTKLKDSEQYSASLKADELLGKHLKLFTEKHEVTGKDGAPITTIAVNTDSANLKEVANQLNSILND